jgi:hypothetical protein
MTQKTTEKNTKIGILDCQIFSCPEIPMLVYFGRPWSLIFCTYVSLYFAVMYLVYAKAIWYIFGCLVYFFLVLVYCTKENLATLISPHSFYCFQRASGRKLGIIGNWRNRLVLLFLRMEMCQPREDSRRSIAKKLFFIRASLAKTERR